MARKPTPAKAKASKASPDAKASAPAIEPKPDRPSNRLLTAPAIHADLKPLCDALAMVSAFSALIARCYHKMLAEKESRGLPRPEEWPESFALERMKATRGVDAEKGDAVADILYCEPYWTRLMREWSGYYLEWCAAIATATELAKSPAVAAIMNAGELRPAHRWTTQTIFDLDHLAGTLHPIFTGGVDGLGFIRAGLPALPQEFRIHAEAVGKRTGELRAVPAVDDLIDRLAVASNGMPELKSLPGPDRTEVVLWEGADHSERNVRLARTRSAYQEAHGNVTDALAALKAAGNEVSRSTFYNHLNALDKATPRWRESVQLSNTIGNLDGMRIVRTRGNQRDKMR